jgi:hypothetical protein
MCTIKAKYKLRFTLQSYPPALLSGSKKRVRMAWLPLQPQGLREETLLK